ncbi:hypothetical protein PVK06_035694 [Gossypium arboreum]|uniref:Uncharacterized protein n=1 Tax=Gossypium arboreum TaxID=29729 RepID=A0ABR0NIM7_GOSAR|nr:hypothetical protein PVK06_035694 [Gossypium arboreum]
MVGKVEGVGEGVQWVGENPTINYGNGVRYWSGTYQGLTTWADTIRMRSGDMSLTWGTSSSNIDSIKDCMTYIDEVYRLERAYNVWKSEFSPVPDESMWPPTCKLLSSWYQIRTHDAS